ncbi:DUF4123 domain-containing protein [Chromobacterium sp. IIBBL 290-4]|uniref:DUF4123 domain-containing protein n=1 Tax=Chromobacterium sp. IIBBL 290-4 TaxID=2953890 RepID=UPI0020B6B3C4|nr:DUF4123 domain-containing protein [Chromobacterium sp. IIBBL 290-4]UTH76615.1 DUF4123 domain-containing protein [Chromobacterium sp. IIBBL 290-4]
MKPQIVMTAPSPEAWLEMLLQTAKALELSWLDLIVDQAELGSRWQSRVAALHSPRMLLQGTPHAEAADEGPVLLRLDANQPQTRLLKLLRQWQGQPRVLALFSGWDYDQLAERLTLCMQASWDKGLQQGVLRYHDPRLFAAVVDALDEPRRQLLLEPAAQWHWLDRDGNARMLDAVAIQSLPPLEWRNDTLTLEQEHIDALSSWHLAETWRQNHLLVPESYGLDSEEEMIRRLALAHQAADKAKLWSEVERLPLVERYLGQEPA